MGLGPLIIFLVVALPLLAFLGWILWRRWTVIIPPRHAGLVIRRGRPTGKTLPAGVHFTSPWNQTVQIYPDYEMTYMTVPLDRLGPDSPLLQRSDVREPGATLPAERLAAGGGGDVDYTDPPFGVVDHEKVGGDVYYTLRFTIDRNELKQIHERFGALGIKGIVRDESRRVIQETFAGDDYRLADLIGPSRTALEQVLTERLAARLAANGFTLAFLSLQEPDLRELGLALREQVKAREELALEQLRYELCEATVRRAISEAQTTAKIEAERVRTRTAAEAEATIVRGRAEAEAEEERVLRRAGAAARVEEMKAAKRLELAAIEADIRLKRAESIARASKTLAGELTELLVRLETVESWREVMDRWDGRMALIAAGQNGMTSLPALESLVQAPGVGSQTVTEAENGAVAAKPAEVDGYGN